ncbi:hypothetical protein E2C01_037553 [Portunus trituberculatus]|uniref:Uncharacterized protein n=1 Tax=Portunus trituberculatus TaxID=210409 RepID=A0A5B7FFY3_PORTR|nr:hypothetical protein [Portunus trituberculatus]
MYINGFISLMIARWTCLRGMHFAIRQQQQRESQMLPLLRSLFMTRPAPLNYISLHCEYRRVITLHNPRHPPLTPYSKQNTNTASIQWLIPARHPQHLTSL